MAVKIQNTTAIDDNKNFYLPRVNMSDATYVNASGGGLRFQLDNPNAYNNVLINARFGNSIAANEYYFAVASGKAETTTTGNVGAVHVYDQQTMKLMYSLYGDTSSFGTSVSMSPIHLIVGAQTQGADQGGKAYIYDISTGSLLFSLNNPNTFSTGLFDRFGYSVGISGNYAIVGAYSEDDVLDTDGKAYIYDVTTGALVWTLNEN